MESLEIPFQKSKEEFVDPHFYIRIMIESIPDALVAFDENGLITDVNQEMTRLTGCTRAELIESRFKNHFTDPEKAAEGVRRSFKKGKVTNYELVMRSKTGKETPVSFNATVYKDQKGRVRGVFAAARDISETKQVVKELEEVRAYTRGLIESSPDALVAFDEEGFITDVNQEMTRLTGCTRAELIESRFKNHFTDPEKAAEGVRRSFKKGKVTNYELVMRSKTGKETPVSFNATVYKDQKGRVRGVFAAARDVTDLRRLQQQLIMAEKHAGVGRLAAGVAHEIKNQLAPALIEAQRVVEYIESGKQPTPEFILQRAQTIEEATRSANKITLALLDYAKETRPAFVYCNLEDSIKNAVSLYTSRCHRANIQLKLEISEVFAVHADKKQIEQVLVNIIDNAYEAIVSQGKGGVISISVQKEARHAIISIQDTGIGIPQEEQSKIFDPFFTSRLPRGTGLGLSVSYGIIEKHGGRIDFESEPGKGSLFKIYLPILPIKKEEKNVIQTSNFNM